MRVRIDRTRMAMGRDSRCYAYAGYVLDAEAPQVDQYAVTSSILDSDHSRIYYPFHAATLPAEHWQMGRGIDRYAAYCAHEREAKVELLALAKTVYPELANVTEWPGLWIELPAIDAEHATRYAEYNTTPSDLRGGWDGPMPEDPDYWPERGAE